MTTFRKKVDLPELLQDLGFILGFKGDNGYMFLQHPELMIELLVPERGRGSEGVKNLPALGMNAQPLRFLDVALMKTIHLHFEDVPVTVPHPAAFALHKLLVAPRRKNAEKKQKDIAAAMAILDLVEKQDDWAVALDLMKRFPRSWKRTVLTTLLEHRRAGIAELLSQ
jgi:hypothetical protein